MSYAELLAGFKFQMYDRCRCGGVLKESYKSHAHVGYDVKIYPEKNAAVIFYRSMQKFSGQLSELETKLNDILPKETAA